ncbi:MAG: hypothetical protein GDA43_06315 [Hormoscilla sp. SP5CHS1]|nr:hypothetical protein [Hormoscilla sp. SP5CHS1]MBC6475400.1 hypothetical protein [Hormoscilla sp. GM102CHS1]
MFGTNFIAVSCSKCQYRQVYTSRDFLPGDEVQSVQFPEFILPANQVLSPPLVEELIRE